MAPGSQLLPRPLSSRQASLTVRWRTDWTMAEEDHATAVDKTTGDRDELGSLRRQLQGFLRPQPQLGPVEAIISLRGAAINTQVRCAHISP